jgi:anaerobic selenocysteine-containing dehydrogenase
MPHTKLRICPFCEATCGLAVDLEGDRVVGVRGDEEDVFSHGFLCPKAYALKELHHDPDRLRTPLVRRAGVLEPATWEEADALVAEKLGAILAAEGRDAVAVYLGNPTVHNLALALYGRVFLTALGTKNVYSASTVDQMPKQVSAGLMFGTLLSIPVPDVDRSDFLLMLGANPLVSNGSLLTAPDLPGKLRAIVRRGGQVVVIDPQRTRTAKEATAHHFIRPGTDAHLLFALVHVLCAEGLARLGRLAEHTAGVDRVAELARPFTPEAAERRTGVPAETIRELARGLARARRPAVYGRIGTCTQAFGTLASWLVDVVNVLVGALDHEGGAMFARGPVASPNTRGQPGRGKGVSFGRHASRVRGAPEVYGELPVACLAEEIETPGPGRVRALVTVAGNPVLSTPNGARLERALGELELLVALDLYVNETTRHATVIYPALSPLEQSHHDVALRQLAVRNVASYSPPTFPPPPGQRAEWQTLLRLSAMVSGAGRDADLEQLDGLVASQLVAREPAFAGRDPAEVVALTAPRVGPDRLLDILLRAGPYRLTLDQLEAAPHGLDLGALAPRVPEVLRTRSGKIELAPEPIVADVPRLAADLGARGDDLVLVGRRELRSNNSWMHNLEVLVKGPARCTLRIHPDDARRLGLGDRARVRSRTGAVEIPVEVTEDIAPGVVSIPHGWGHDPESATLRVAARHAGVSANLLSDETALDPLSGNAVLCGIPVVVEAA